MALGSPFEYAQKVLLLVKDSKAGALDDELKRVDNLYKFCDIHEYLTFAANKNVDEWPGTLDQSFGVNLLMNHGIQKEVALLIS